MRKKDERERKKVEGRRERSNGETTIERRKSGREIEEGGRKGRRNKRTKEKFRD
jgi:hypothetical protein